MHHKRKQSHLARAFDRAREFALVRGADGSFSAGENFRLRAQKPLQDLGVFVVHVIYI